MHVQSVAVCTDTHDSNECLEWAARKPSECDENPNFMHAECKRACNSCQHEHCEYLVEEGTDYLGNDIGTCGTEKVMSALRDACTNNAEGCVGFTTNPKNFEGWCAKASLANKYRTSDHNFYRIYCSTDTSIPTFGQCTPRVYT
jgi:hypothetical protein